MERESIRENAHTHFPYYYRALARPFVLIFLFQQIIIPLPPVNPNGSSRDSILNVIDSHSIYEAVAETPTGSITAMAVPSQTNCVAPCAVFFDATGTTYLGQPAEEKYVSLDFQWNFGDPNSGFWTEGARARGGTPQSKNVEYGFVVAHVFENPGTYSVNLTVTNGSDNDVLDSPILITVTDSDIQWAGTQTICIANGSTPIAGSDSCPEGAQVFSQSDFVIAIQTHCNVDNAAVRCLFKGGDTFTAAAEVGIFNTGPSYIGSYGSGKASVNLTSGNRLFRLQNGNSELRVVDLKINGYYSDTNGDGLNDVGDTDAFYSGESGGWGDVFSKFLSLRVDIENFDTGYYFWGRDWVDTDGDGVTDRLVYDPSTRMHSELAIVDGSVLHGTGLAGNDIFIMANQLAILGNRLGDKRVGRGEHVMRTRYVSKALYAHNALGLIEDNPLYDGCDPDPYPSGAQGNTIMKFASGFAVALMRLNRQEEGMAREFTVADNYISNCRINAWDLNVGPTDCGAAKAPEHFKNFVIEGNHFVAAYNERTNGSGRFISLSSNSHFVVRNNVFDATNIDADSDGISSGISVTAIGYNTCTDQVGLAGYIPGTDGRIYNNTFYQGTSTTLGRVFVNLGGATDFSGMKISNNLTYSAGQPVIFLSNGGNDITCCDGSCSVSQGSCNISATQNAFSGAISYPSLITQFALRSDATEINAGIDLPGQVQRDAAGNSRPQDTGWDVGAHEYTPNINMPPVLNPIGDQSLQAGTSSNVAVSASDADVTDLLTFSLTSPAPWITITDHGNGTATLQLDPSVTDTGTYYPVVVTVNDNGNPSQLTLEDFTVTVTQPPVGNQPPVANAGGDQIVNTNQAVTLDGSGSTDPDNQPDQLVFTWMQDPTDSIQATLAGADQAVATFTAPSTAAVLHFALTVWDGTNMDVDEVIITVQSQTPPPTNLAPSVDAGPDLTTTLSHAVTPYATVSDDGLPTPVSLTLTWSKFSGPGTVTFNNPNVLNTLASFSAAGIYVLRLTASDGSLSSGNNVQVTVNNEIPLAGLPNVVGINLERNRNNEPQIPFVDVMKQSGQTGFHPWSAWSATDTSALDPLGYPLQVVPPQVVSTVMLNNPLGIYPTGDYTLIFDGDGQISLTAAGNSQTFASTDGTDNTYTFNVATSNSSGIQLSILESNIADHVRNIRLIMPGHAETYQTEPFNPAFVDRLRGFSTIRTMNIIPTNGQLLSTWNQRTPMNHVTQTHGYGIAYEYAIDLCNLINADLWFNIPHLADDNYVTQLAQLINDRLEAGRKVYIEYSNEVWNGLSTFTQTPYVRDQGQALGLDADRTVAGRKFYAKRSAKIFELFENVFGAGSARMVRVLGGFAAGTQVATDVLSTFNQTSINNINNGQPVDINPLGIQADAIAIAPYFGNGLEDELLSRADTVTVSEILDRLEATHIPMVINRVTTHKALTDANSYPIDLIAYEVGQHLRAANDAGQVISTVLADKFTAANRDPRMYSLYRYYIDNWLAAGGSVMNQFNFVDTYSQLNSWGALEYLEQPTAEAHKYRALMDIISEIGSGQPPTNLPPQVSAITSDVTDVDPVAAELQIYEGTTVIYSGSASDPNGDVLDWEWLYTIDGGPEFPVDSDLGVAVRDVIFNYPLGSAPKTYVWILRANDGTLSSESALTVYVVSAPPPPCPVEFCDDYPVDISVNSNIDQATVTQVVWDGLSAITYDDAGSNGEIDPAGAFGSGLALLFHLNDQTTGPNAPILDAVGQTPRGITVGSPDGTASGKFATTAYLFDGSGTQAISVADPNMIEGVGAFSVSAWVKRSGVSGWGSIIGQSGGNSNDVFDLYYNPSGSYTFEVETSIRASAPGNFDTNWHHLAGVFDGVTISIYFDGVLAASTPYTGPTLTSTDPLTIGRSARAYFPGTIDEVAVWSRALSASEITQLFGQTPVVGTFTSTVIPMDGNQVIPSWEMKSGTAQVELQFENGPWTAAVKNVPLAPSAINGWPLAQHATNFRYRVTLPGVGNGIDNFSCDWNIITQFPPIANAGADISVTDSSNDGQENITLDGSGSIDQDGGTITNYLWEDITNPVNPVTLGAGLTLTIPLLVGVYTVKLTVTDNDALTASDSLVVTVNLFVPPSTYYVDNTLTEDCAGNYSITNRDCTGTDGDAFNTLQEAANVVNPGDTVEVRGGTYTTSSIYECTAVLEVNRGGEAGAPITFQAHKNPADDIYENVILDAQLTYRRAAVIKANYIVIDGLTFVNGKSTGLEVGPTSGCYYAGLAHDVTVKNSIARDNGTLNTWLGGFHVGYYPSYNIIFEYDQSYNNGSGFWIGAPHQTDPGQQPYNVTIRYSSAHDNVKGGGNSSGVILHGTRNSLVSHVVSYRNSDGGNGTQGPFADDNIFEYFTTFGNDDTLAPEGTQTGNGRGLQQGNVNPGLAQNGPIYYSGGRNTLSHHIIAFDNKGNGINDAQGSDNGIYYHVLAFNNTLGESGWGGLGSESEGGHLVNGQPYYPAVTIPATIKNSIAYHNECHGRNFYYREGATVLAANLTTDPSFVTPTPDLCSQSTLTVDTQLYSDPQRHIVNSHFGVVDGLHLQAGSLAIDAGTFISGFHCEQADDDPVLPYPANDANCVHWYGTAPDIGPYEYQPAAGGNQAPVVSDITHDALDRDPVTTGLQVSEGDVITYSGSVIDPDGDTVSWEWLYTVDGGSEYSVDSGAGISVRDVTFNYPSGIAPQTYVWMLKATDGELNAFSELTVGIISRPALTIVGSLGGVVAGSGGGTISPSGPINVDYGGTLTFTITPDPGSHIDNVVVDDVSVGAVSTYTFSNVIFDHSISANFSLNTYTITATAGNGGTISPSGNVTASYGEDVTITITPDVGYHISDVLIDNFSVGTAASHTFTTVSADHIIHVEFEMNTYTIAASAGLHGTISPSGAIPVQHGQDATFSITPDPGYHAAQILVDSQPVNVGTAYTFSSVTQNHSISATFAIDNQAPTVTAGPDQTITLPANATLDGTVSDENLPTLVTEWTQRSGPGIVTFSNVNAIDTTASFSLPGTYRLRLTATDEGGLSALDSLDVIVNPIPTHTIDVNAGIGGIIDPTGPITLSQGASQVFTMMPSTGYHIADVLVDGVSVGALSTYTFDNVSASHTIAVSFAIDNQGPVAQDQNVTVTEDSSVAIPLGATDPNGDTLTYTIVSAPTNGQLSGITANRTYTPNANFSGADQFTFKANDGTFDSNLATVFITVTPSNDAPTALTQGISVNEDGSVSITLEGFDTEGDSLTFTVVKDPEQGTLSGSSPNLTYAPFANVDSHDYFIFRVNDGLVDSEVAVVTIDIISINDAPTADSQTVNMDEDAITPITLSGSDIEIPNSNTGIRKFELAFSPVPRQPFTREGWFDAFGKVQQNAEFIMHFADIDWDAFASTPNVANSPAIQELDFIAGMADLYGIEIFVVIDVRTPDWDAVQTRGGFSNANVRSAFKNFSEYLANRLKPRYMALGSEINSYLKLYPAETSHLLSLISETVGVVKQVSPATLLTATFQYEELTGALDGMPEWNMLIDFESNMDFVAISTYPSFLFDDPESIPSDYYSQLSQHTSKPIVIAESGWPSGGDPSFHGSEDKQARFITKLEQLTASLNVKLWVWMFLHDDMTGLGNPPFFQTMGLHSSSGVPKQAWTIWQQLHSKPLTSNVQSLSYTLQSEPLRGVLTGSVPNLTYAPFENYYGSDEFTYLVNDGASDSSLATISITVTPVNDTPMAEEQHISTPEDTPLALTLTGTDVDGDALIFTIIGNPSNGELTGTPPQLTYTPNLDFYGQDNFTFQTDDGFLQSNVTNIGITITPVDDPLPTRTLQLTVSGQGSVTKNPDLSTYTHGSEVLLTALPDTGHHFTGWSGDLTGDVSPTTLIMDEDKSITASFAINTYTITASSGANGSITPTGDVTVDHGTSQIFTMAPSTGYHVSDVWVDGVSVEALTEYTFDNVTQNHSISATFAIDNLAPTVNAGSDQTVTLPANATLDGTVSDENLSTLVIEWTQRSGPGIVTFGNASVVDTTASFSLPGSYRLRLTATDEGGLSVLDSLDVIVNPIPTYSIDASAEVGGSITPSGTIILNQGASQTFTMAPSTGYHVSDVWVDGVSVGALSTHTFNNVSANHTISVNFALNTYTLTLATAGQGSITKSPDLTSYTHGSQVTLTAVPVSGYHLTSWGGDLTGDVSPTTLIMDEDKSITASFAINTYTITASSGANGSITPTGDVTVDHGTSQIFTMAPSTGYHIADVLVDGSSVGTLSTYTFNNISANHTIQVSFSADRFVLTVSAPNGRVDLDPSLSDYAGGSTVTMAAIPELGYRFSSWLINGVSALWNPYLLTITSNTDITANFNRNRLPSASAQNVETGENTSVAITLRGDDPDGDSLLYSITTPPLHGQLSGIAPSLTFTPNNAFHGTDSFTFKTNDGELDSLTAVVSIRVLEPRPRIVGSAPSDGFIDPLEDLDADTLQPQGISTVTISFDRPIFNSTGGPVTSSEFSITETGSVAPPQILSLTSLSTQISGSNAHMLTLARSITPGERTTITARVFNSEGSPIDPAGDQITINFLPGDVDQSGTTTRNDITALRAHLASNADKTLYDIDRNGFVNQQDLRRLRQLLAGTRSTRAWENVSLPFVTSNESVATQTLAVQTFEEPAPAPTPTPTPTPNRSNQTAGTSFGTALILKPSSSSSDQTDTETSQSISSEPSAGSITESNSALPKNLPSTGKSNGETGSLNHIVFIGQTKSQKMEEQKEPASNDFKPALSESELIDLTATAETKDSALSFIARTDQIEKSGEPKETSSSKGRPEITRPVRIPEINSGLEASARPLATPISSVTPAPLPDAGHPAVHAQQSSNENGMSRFIADVSALASNFVQQLLGQEKQKK